MIKYHEIPQKKFNKNEMNGLMKEVERSRIAVENITKFTSMEGKYKKELNHLQDDLQTCITSIAAETKKQKVFNQLILILKGEMFQYQATKKKAEEAEQLKKDKLVNKYQYEVDQILQKHNQEIAKIHNLKDLANSRRSERVVYSSLFKKLEKEIKYYEQIYKQQVMYSEYIKNNSYKSSCEVKNNSTLKEATEILSMMKPIGSPKNNQTSFDNFQPWNGFLTTGKEQSSNKNSFNFTGQKKFHPALEQDKLEIRSNFGKEQKFAHTKELLRQISQQNNLVQRFKIHVECSTTEEVLEYYGDIQNQNRKLLKKIQECDSVIEKTIKQSQDLRKKGKEEDLAQYISQEDENKCYQNSQLQEHSRIKNQAHSRITEETSHFSQNVQELAQICSVEFTKGNGNVFSHENLRLLYERIIEITNIFQKPYKKSSQRQDTLYMEQVDCLLDKMQKFNICQKIMDKNLLQQEYYKELGKKRQLKSRKEASR